MSDLIYLDYAAASPVDELVLSKMVPFFSDEFYNPSATYLQAKSVKSAVEEARAKIAQVIGAKPSEIIFTAGGTEANNLALKGLIEESDHLLVSAIEHESILTPAHMLKGEQIEVDQKGRIDLADLQAKITDDTKLISVMYANNEIGTIQPIKEIVCLIENVRKDRRVRNVAKPIYVHSDACQAANYLDLHVSRLGVDLMTVNGGKIYGPKQSGVLFVKAGIQLKPLIEGGGQERGLRSGTENVPFIMGFAEALDKAQQSRHEESKRLEAIQAQTIDKLTNIHPGIVINGHLKHRLANNIHITIPGQDNERLIFGFDDRGIMLAAGSACSASDETPSHVLRAIGLSDFDAQSSLRLTMGRQTTQEQMDRFVNVLGELIRD